MHVMARPAYLQRLASRSAHHKASLRHIRNRYWSHSLRMVC